MKLQVRSFSAIRTFFSNLNRVQRLYYLSFVYLLFSLAFLPSSWQFNVAGTIALCGLFIEMWPRFVGIWESLLGRVAIISTYIVVANLAVNVASQKLNEIVGIDPSPLFYSTGFVTLLMAPIWLLFVTLVVMLSYMLVVHSLLLLRLAARVTKLNVMASTSKQVYELRTALLKTIVIPVMFVPVVASIETYGYFLVDGSIEITGVRVDEEFVRESEVKKGQGELEAESGGQLITANSGMRLDINKTIASFIFNIDLYAFSQCEKSKEERAMFIGETDILVAKRNENSRSGYDFVVRQCQLNNKVHAMPSD